MEKIPDSFRDLVDGPICVALSTIMPGGQPQTTVVWCSYDGEYILINTMRDFRKAKNMQANPKVTILAYEPHNPLRFLEVRGTVVEMTEEGAVEHLDELSELYTGKRPYFGRVVSAEFKQRETPVLCKIAPTRVVAVPSKDRK